MQVVILPGLDGTDLLLGRFVALAPLDCRVAVLPLPDNPVDDYDSLAVSVGERIRQLGSCHLVAESFSGPLGILIARRHPELIRQLTLVASFVKSPGPGFARWLPWSWLFRLPLPIAVAKYLFVGNDHDLATRLRTTVRQTSAATMAQRVRCTLEVDVCRELASLNCPVRYLRPTFDRLVPVRSVRKIREINPCVTIHEIDGPHLILQTCPRQSWKIIHMNCGTTTTG
ncbi:MAG: alpha/beta hydrolase [Planctomycetaceae bacterium]|nr:alpha/beta hydrolase [Planctomycetaceae bacterium]